MALHVKMHSKNNRQRKNHTIQHFMHIRKPVLYKIHIFIYHVSAYLTTEAERVVFYITQNYLEKERWIHRIRIWENCSSSNYHCISSVVKELPHSLATREPLHKALCLLCTWSIYVYFLELCYVYNYMYLFEKLHCISHFRASHWLLS